MFIYLIIFSRKIILPRFGLMVYLIISKYLFFYISLHWQKCRMWNMFMKNILRIVF